MPKRWTSLVAALVALAGSAAPAAAQEDNPAAHCRGVPDDARPTCYAVAQAVASAQPQLGILIAGGNPSPGTATTRGLRLGVAPGVDATARLNLAFVRLPDVLAEQAGEGAARLNRAVGIPAPALGGNLSVGVFPGVSVAPGIGGIGSMDLLGSATWLPFRAFDTHGFGAGSPDLAWGAGARLGLLRESFVAPGVSLSAMYRTLGTVGFGEVEAGDAGEFSFNLNDWSTRLAVSKRFLGLGLTGGIGYDRFESDYAFAVRQAGGLLPLPWSEPHGGEGTLRADRWSAFVNTSYTLLFGTLALEGGWLQGGAPLPEFAENVESDFDPRRGTFFGSLAVRLAF